MGHTFGVMEQFFAPGGLLPPSVHDSPFHFRTLATWSCARGGSSVRSQPALGPGCGYKFSASSSTTHLPLHLSTTDVSSLLRHVPPEVGALCAAHLSSNGYDYGPCPQCGVGQMRARAASAAYSPLLLVELGRTDGGVAGSASSLLPYQLDVSPTMVLQVGGVAQEYAAVAIVYNDGTHWWSDMLCGGHFRVDEHGEPLGTASYRYDGLECEGQLRYCGTQLKPTSDCRYMSFVVYRRGETPPRA